MRWIIRREWLMVVAALAISGSTELWSADPLVSGDVGEIERIRLDVPSEPASYVQAGFTPQGTMNNSMTTNNPMMDNGQAMRMYGQPRRPVHNCIVHFIHTHQTTRARIQSHDEYVHAWFNYTRGIGPANWAFP